MYIVRVYKQSRVAVRNIYHKIRVCEKVFTFVLDAILRYARRTVALQPVFLSASTTVTRISAFMYQGWKCSG